MATTVPESAAAVADARETRVLARFIPAANVTSEQYDETPPLEAGRRVAAGGPRIPRRLLV
jgi:hypothetical protein